LLPSPAVARPTADRSTDHSRPPPRGTTTRSPAAPAAWGRREPPVVLDRPPPTAPGFRKQARSIARGQPYYRTSHASAGSDAPSKPPFNLILGAGPQSPQQSARTHAAMRGGSLPRLLVSRNSSRVGRQVRRDRTAALGRRVSEAAGASSWPVRSDRPGALRRSAVRLSPHPAQTSPDGVGARELLPAATGREPSNPVEWAV
jgi:hypothetical protein